VVELSATVEALRGEKGCLECVLVDTQALSAEQAAKLLEATNALCAAHDELEAHDELADAASENLRDAVEATNALRDAQALSAEQAAEQAAELLEATNALGWAQVELFEATDALGRAQAELAAQEHAHKELADAATENLRDAVEATNALRDAQALSAEQAAEDLRMYICELKVDALEWARAQLGNQPVAQQQAQALSAAQADELLVARNALACARAQLDNQERAQALSAVQAEAQHDALRVVINTLNAKQSKLEESLKGAADKLNRFSMDAMCEQLGRV
jgi:hypothetical protein